MAKTPPKPPDQAKARQAARQLISRFGFQDPGRIDLEAIAMTREVLVREDSLEGAEAWLVRSGGRGLVRVRDDIPEVGRKRFAIAHELGHWELHSLLSQWTSCDEREIHHYKGSTAEIEANAFAAELLMPPSLFRPLCNTSRPSLGAIRDLSDRFRTTLTATAVRFVEECREPCQVVFSEEGRVTWTRRHDRLKDLWIERGQLLTEASIASDVLHGHEAREGMELVPADAWFQSIPGNLRLEVREESIRLGRYPTILTLLWVIRDDCDEPEDG